MLLVFYAHGFNEDSHELAHNVSRICHDFPSVSNYVVYQVEMKLKEDNEPIEFNGETVDTTVESVEESVGNVLFTIECQ